MWDMYVCVVKCERKKESMDGWMDGSRGAKTVDLVVYFRGEGLGFEG